MTDELKSGANRPFTAAHMSAQAQTPGAREVDRASRSGRVLLVDDDPAVLRAFARELEEEGYAVLKTDNGAAALELVRARELDVVVSDLRMPQMDGIELLRALRSADLDLPVILVTGDPEVESASAAVELGAFRYLAKPVAGARLVEVVAKAMQARRLARLRRLAFTYVLGGDLPNLDASLDRALDTLWIAHQPIVDARSQATFAYEALLRTREPSIPNPHVFVDVARRLGALSDLGRRVRNAAANDAVALPDGASLFVNLTPEDLSDDNLLDVAAPLSKMASRTVLEITERGSLEQIPDVRDRVAALRKMGFRVALDDLGAGYAGLNSFALLEPDVVKLDMALVRGVDRDRTKHALVRTMISVCKEMNIVVVGEGVETAGERAALIDLGCDLLQGFLFAEPAAGYPIPSW